MKHILKQTNNFPGVVKRGINNDDSYPNCFKNHKTSKSPLQHKVRHRVAAMWKESSHDVTL